MAAHTVKIREPVEISKYQYVVWQRFHELDVQERQRDVFFRVVRDSLVCLWPLVRPIAIEAEFGSTKTRQGSWVNIQATHLPDGLELQSSLRVPPAEVSHALSSPELLVTALEEARAAVTPSTADEDHDLIALVVRAAYLRIDDATKDPAMLHVYHRPAQFDWQIPLLERDGHRWIVSPNHHLEPYDPIEISFDSFRMRIESYWPPWCIKGTASHQALEDMLRSLDGMGWEASEPVEPGDAR